MKKQKSSRFPLTFFILLLLAALTVFFIIRGNNHLSVETEELSFPGLPAGFDGFRIVQLSDMHERSFGENNSDLFGAVRDSKPDIIVVTGDIVHSKGKEAYILNAFEKLSAIAPTYYVAGNHEWAVSGLMPKIRDIALETGVMYLSNGFVSLDRGGDTIFLAGIEDPNGPRDMKTPEKLVEEIKLEASALGVKSPFITALYHRNDRLSRYAAAGIDLVICGHAHGGVIRLPFTDGILGPGRDILPSYTAGLYTENGGAMFVSRGLGSSSPLETRIWNDPHVPVLILRKG